MESQPKLKLQSLVVLGGKWLPFSQVGGIPMSARDPCWWHINRVPNNMTRKQLPQTKWFILFLSRASVPITNDCIWSFNSQPLILCQWLPNRVTYLIKCWKPTFRQMAKWKSQPKEQQTYGRWKKETVPLSAHQRGPLSRGCH